MKKDVLASIFAFRSCIVNQLGREHKIGAGVLDMQFEDEHTLLTCGYDTYVRMWDLRTNQWYDSPFILLPTTCYILLTSLFKSKLISWLKILQNCMDHIYVVMNIMKYTMIVEKS